MMKEEVRKKIEVIMGDMQCPKNFKCAESGFEDLCKAKDVGLDSYLKCLESNPSNCNFALSYGYKHFCQCPLRVYLAKKLNKP
jgi:hypothetical protein